MNFENPSIGIQMIFDYHEHPFLPDKFLDDSIDNFLHLITFLLTVDHPSLKVDPQQIAN